MPDKNLADKATAALAAIEAFDPQSLARGGPFDFSSAINDAKAVKRLFAPLQVAVFERLPNNILNTISGQLHESAELLNSARTFQPERSDNANRDYKNILQGLQSATDRMLGTLNELTAAIVPSLNAGSMTSPVQPKATELDTSLAKSKETLQQVMTTLAEARAELGHVITSKEAKRFDDEAKAHGKAAVRWLVASVTMAVATGLFALTGHSILSFFELTVGSVGDLQYFSSKAILFVALLYLLYFCGRSYATSRHNETVNRHRANALSTYGLLTASVNDEKNRDLVLAAAAAAIFSPQDTGFLKQSADADLTKMLLDKVGRRSAGT